MPFSLEWIAAQMGPPIRVQLKSFSDVVARLALWLEKRTKQVEPLWWRTRDFPIVQVRDDSITVYIESSQHHTLRGMRPAPGFVEGWRLGAQDFMRAMQRPREAIAEAYLLPDFTHQLDVLLERITNAITSFTQPDRTHFDPWNRNVFDLFGQAALVGGTLLGGTRTLMRIRNDLAQARSKWDPAQPPGPRPPPPTSRTLAESLDMGARYILGGILLLPQLSEYIGILIDAAGARLHSWVQGRFQWLLDEFLRLRRQIVESVQQHLPHLIVLGLGTVLTARDILMDNLRFYAVFAIMYGRESAAILQNFLDALRAYIDDLIDTINTVLHVVTAVLDFDLVPVIVAFIAPPVALLNAVAGVPLPHFTVGDWLSVEASMARTTARLALETWLRALETAALGAAAVEGTGDTLLDLSPAYGAYHWIRYGTWLRQNVRNYSMDIRGRIRAVRDLVHIALGTPARLPDVPQGGFRIMRMPNIADTIFGPDRGAALVRRIVDARRTVLAEAPLMIGAAGVMMSDLATQGDQWAREASEMGSVRQYAGIAAWATRLAQQLEPAGQYATRMWNPRQPGQRSLSEAFDAWLSDRGADGAMAIVVSAIPIYVESLANLWVEHQNDASPIIVATSPHILARAARLARVHVPKVTVQAEGRALDDQLADAIATQFRAKMNEAYNAGNRELDNRTRLIQERERREAREVQRDLRRPWPPPPERPHPPQQRRPAQPAAQGGEP